MRQRAVFLPCALFVFVFWAAACAAGENDATRRGPTSTPSVFVAPTPDMTPIPASPAVTPAPQAAPTTAPPATAVPEPSPMSLPTPKLTPKPTPRSAPPPPTPIATPVPLPDSSGAAVRVVVLMYHMIYPPGVPVPNGEHWSSTYEQFTQQMAWFAAHDFRTITADELYEFIVTGYLAHPRSFLPVFDDNWYASVKERVFPVMRQYGFVPTLALYTGHIYERATNAFTWAELKAWVDAGTVDVQSHSVSHPLSPPITKLSDDALWHELADSKAELEQRLGKVITSFIAPGGAYDKRVMEMARKAGYQTFLLLEERGGISYGHDPYFIYRVNMVETLNFDTFVRKIMQYTGVTP